MSSDYRTETFEEFNIEARSEKIWKKLKPFKREIACASLAVIVASIGFSIGVTRVFRDAMYTFFDRNIPVMPKEHIVEKDFPFDRRYFCNRKSEEVDPMRTVYVHRYDYNIKEYVKSLCPFYLPTNDKFCTITPLQTDSEEYQRLKAKYLKSIGNQKPSN